MAVVCFMPRMPFTVGMSKISCTNEGIKWFSAIKSKDTGIDAVFLFLGAESRLHFLLIYLRYNI